MTRNAGAEHEAGLPAAVAVKAMDRQTLLTPRADCAKQARERLAGSAPARVV